MLIGPGTRFRVVKGGGELGLKKGEIWDLVDSQCGLQFRKMNKRGGSVRVMNGYQAARSEMDAGRLELIEEAGS